MANILINATATNSTGALQILNDYLRYISSKEDGNIYYLFTILEDFKFDTNYIKIITVKKFGWVKRILWDEIWLYIYCKLRNIRPDVIISMQNTGSLFPGIPKIIYYHQSIPLIRYDWKFYRKDEFKLLLYSKFYFYFVKRHSTEAYFVVQLEYIKKLLLAKYKGLSNEKVIVIKPNEININVEGIYRISIDSNKVNLFYPATNHGYKNHRILIEALVYLKEKQPDFYDLLNIYFTVDLLPPILMKSVYEKKLNNIKFIGRIPHDKVMQYYKSVDLVLFPSKIETFGLPLIEAKHFNVPIIASNLPYAIEVLNDYGGKIFVDADNHLEWANAIKDFKRIHYTKYDHFIDEGNSWEKMNNLIEKILNVG